MTITENAKQEQRQLVDEYATEAATRGGKVRPKALEYYKRNISRVVVLSDGRLYAINKKPIVTSFCFGYGLNGVATVGEISDACGEAQNARTNEDYFIAENLREFSPFDKMDADYWTPYVSASNGEIAHIEFISPFGIAHGWADGMQRLTAEDEATLRAAYEEEKAVHLKKVIAYLKRYGLSKVRAWSYLVD